MSRATTVLARSLGVLIVTAALAGCSPTPEPTPIPTGFASEEEAFAAAEATYRAYVAATNAQREDPAYSPAPESFLRGDLLDAEVAFEQEMQQAGLSVVGETMILDVTPVSTDARLTQSQIEICLDSSATRIVDADGTDATPVDREELNLVLATVAWTTEGGVIIASETERTGQC